MKSKECSKCGKEKPLTEFYKHSQMADGHLNKCKECAREYDRNRRKEDPEAVREYDRLRAKLPHRRDAIEKYRRTDSCKRSISLSKKRWAERNREKRSANVAVGNAIRDGKIAKKPCEKCGSVRRVHAHHDDYSRPLDVRWLCPECHAKHHRLARKA